MTINIKEPFLVNVNEYSISQFIHVEVTDKMSDITP